MEINVSKYEWKTLYRSVIKASLLIEEKYTTPRQRNVARILRKTIRDIARKNKID